MVVFTLGTSVFTASRDPILGGFKTTRMWKSPAIRAGGGPLFVKDKSVKKDVHTLSWNPIKETDLVNLITFLDAVNGSGSTFAYTDPLGSSHTAVYRGPDLLSWTPEDIMEKELTIELFVSAS